MGEDIVRPASHAPLRILVCIPTMNRPDKLRNLFDTLQEVRDRIDIVVSDDSSREECRLETRAITLQTGGTYLTGPRTGVCANRNNCLSAVREHSYILFLDDDCEVVEGSWPALFRYLEGLSPTESARTIIAGREMASDGTLTPPYRMHFFGFYEKSERPVIFSCKATIYPADFFRNACWNENIYFGYEDAELAMQAERLKFEIVDFPEFRVFDSMINASALGGSAISHIASAMIFVGLRRDLYYKKRPDLAIIFFIYQILLALRIMLKRRDFGYPIRVFGKIEWGGIFRNSVLHG